MQFRRTTATLLILSASLGSVALSPVLEPMVAHAKRADDKKQDEGEVDFLELAALMLRDGHLDRADATLRQVDLEQEGVDKARFYELRGLLNLKSKLWIKARDDFKRAIGIGQVKPVVYLYLAQAYYETAEYDDCIRALSQAGEAAKSRPAAYLMWSEAYFKKNDIAAGFRTLEEARKRHPTERAIQRAMVFRLVDAGLYQEAIDFGQGYLETASDAADFVAFGEALRQGGQYHQAREVLELAHLRFPNDEKAVLALTHVYVDQGQNLAGAMLLEKVARFKEELALETAELYRRAGRLERALLWNTRVPDQKKKLRQRLSVLVEMERFGMVAAMEPRLSRLDLLEEENVRYALAYGLFKLNEFKAAEKQLRFLKSSAMFERANQLRRAMETCREQGWECG